MLLAFLRPGRQEAKRKRVGLFLPKLFFSSVVLKKRILLIIPVWLHLTRKCNEFTLRRGRSHLNHYNHHLHHHLHHHIHHHSESCCNEFTAGRGCSHEGFVVGAVFKHSFTNVFSTKHTILYLCIFVLLYLSNVYFCTSAFVYLWICVLLYSCFQTFSCTNVCSTNPLYYNFNLCISNLDQILLKSCKKQPEHHEPTLFDYDRACRA